MCVHMCVFLWRGTWVSMHVHSGPTLGCHFLRCLSCPRLCWICKLGSPALSIHWLSYLPCTLLPAPHGFWGSELKCQIGLASALPIEPSPEIKANFEINCKKDSTMLKLWFLKPTVLWRGWLNSQVNLKSWRAHVEGFCLVAATPRTSVAHCSTNSVCINNKNSKLDIAVGVEDHAGTWVLFVMGRHGDGMSRGIGRGSLSLLDDALALAHSG